MVNTAGVKRTGGVRAMFMKAVEVLTR
jgi:hypothetical protein